jgi:Xaa-Pro aminopeptidase
MSNLDRFREALQENGINLAVLAHFGRVAWVSGHVAFIEKGADPFSGGPALAVIAPDDSALVSTSAAPTNRLQRSLTYAAYDYQQIVNAIGNWREVLLEALQQMGANSAVIGYDADSTPAYLLDGARARFPRAQFKDIGPVIDVLRSLKTKDELAYLRAACALCDVGQQAARSTALAGKSEIEVYSAIHAALEADVKARVPLGADVVSGERTLEMGGDAGERVIQFGELLMTDIHPRHPNGYWGDSCATFVVGGEPSVEQCKVQEILWEALQRGRDLLKPGVKANKVDAVVRGSLNARGYDYPHHSGHGIGATHFERPYIMPWNDETLAEDMVVMLEPGVYQHGIGGMRLEWAFRVTPAGGEPLTRFSLSLEQFK